MRFIKKPTASITISLIVVICLYYFLSQSNSLNEPKPLDIEKDGSNTVDIPFMPKMANETIKAELGRASWKLFHTILARYPDKPSLEERQTLEQYIYLFAKVYPCGDCARHFIKLLEKYPPQTSSRTIASVWGCDVHNKVNKVLGHEIYDCANIIEDYDCGCGDDLKLDDPTLKDKDHLKFEVNNEAKQLGG